MRWVNSRSQSHPYGTHWAPSISNLVSNGILNDILFLRDEDQSFPERCEREHKENQPRQTHKDGHDEVDDIKSINVECVSEYPKRGDPPDWNSG
jgi:hypothetical protein